MSRLDVLERRVSALEKCHAMEADLRASGDRDLSDLEQMLRAQQRTIQALAITQSEHTEHLEQCRSSLQFAHAKLDRHTSQLTLVSVKIDQHDAKLDRHEAQLTAINTKLDQHDTQLTAINTKLDQHDTQLTAINTKLDQHDVKFDQQDAKLDRIIDMLERNSCRDSQ